MYLETIFLDHVSKTYGKKSQRYNS